MKVLCLAWLCTLAAIQTAAGESSAISGTVRDAAGKPLEGATLTLTCSQDTPPAQAVTDRNGAYRFDSLHAGECVIGVQLTGYAPAPQAVRISPATPRPTVDFSLTRGALKFEAAGLRGLIDPGGYSAPAAAAAASGMVVGMADLKRSGASSPCPAGPESARSAQLDPTSDEATQALASAQIAAGQFSSALVLLTALVERRQEPAIYSLLAEAKEGLAMFSQASADYVMAAAKDPSEQNLFGAGYEWILAGSPGKASDTFQSGLKRRPESIQLLIGLGAAQFLNGSGAEAVSTLLRACSLNASDKRSYPFLVKAFAASGAEAERVLASLKRFLDLAPGNAQANYLYALALLQQRSEGAAVDTVDLEKLLTRAAQLDPQASEAYFELAKVCESRGEDACALRNYQAAARLSPDRAEVHYRLAAVYRKAGQAAAALGELETFNRLRAQEKNPDGGKDVELQQFLSVMGKPGNRSEGNVPCGSRERP